MVLGKPARQYAKGPGSGEGTVNVIAAELVAVVELLPRPSFSSRAGDRVHLSAPSPSGPKYGRTGFGPGRRKRQDV